jgi:hypothetical protein
MSGLIVGVVSYSEFGVLSIIALLSDRDIGCLGYKCDTNTT